MEQKQVVSLEDLVGEHLLSGCDFSHESINTWGDHFEDCETINFVLDGKTYTAVEDPDDGYRSSMRDIAITDYKVSNTFEPVKVVGTMRQGEDILDLVATNGKIVLSAGTDSTDAYYPTWVGEWNPENLPQNEQHGKNS